MLKMRGAENSKGEGRMNAKTLQNAEAWAVETLGTAELGDVRRTDRLVKIASALGENPSVSLPTSMPNWADMHAAYQFLGNPAISHEQIMATHFAAIYQESSHRSQVLLIGDATDVNLPTRHLQPQVSVRSGVGRRLGASLYTVSLLLMRKTSSS
jgi:hypothetical protein